MKILGPSVKISVLLPVFNEEPFLEKCLESIRCQTYDNYEVLISDNASTDATWHIIQRYVKDDPFRFKAFRFEIGVHPCFNLLKCSQMASGAVVYHMGGDDYLKTHDIFENAKEVFASEQTGAFISRCAYFDSDTGKSSGLRPHVEFSAALALPCTEFVRFYTGRCSHDELLLGFFDRAMFQAVMVETWRFGVESAGWWICLKLILLCKERGYRVKFDDTESCILMKRIISNRLLLQKNAGYAINMFESPRSKLYYTLLYCFQTAKILKNPVTKVKILSILLFGGRRKTAEHHRFIGPFWGLTLFGWNLPKVYLAQKDYPPNELLWRIKAKLLQAFRISKYTR